MLIKKLIEFWCPIWNRNSAQVPIRISSKFSKKIYISKKSYPFCKMWWYAANAISKAVFVICYIFFCIQHSLYPHPLSSVLMKSKDWTEKCTTQCTFQRRDSLNSFEYLLHWCHHGDGKTKSCAHVVDYLNNQEIHSGRHGY